MGPYAFVNKEIPLQANEKVCGKDLRYVWDIILKKKKTSYRTFGLTEVFISLWI